MGAVPIPQGITRPADSRAWPAPAVNIGVTYSSRSPNDAHVREELQTLVVADAALTMVAGFELVLIVLMAAALRKRMP